MGVEYRVSRFRLYFMLFPTRLLFAYVIRLFKIILSLLLLY